MPVLSLNFLSLFLFTALYVIIIMLCLIDVKTEAQVYGVLILHNTPSITEESV